MHTTPSNNTQPSAAEPCAAGRRWTLRGVVAAVVASAVAFVAVPVAGADGTSLSDIAASSSTTAPSGAGQSGTGQVGGEPAGGSSASRPTPRSSGPGAGLEARYQTLTASMVAKWSNDHDADVDDIVGDDDELYARVAGVDPAGLSKLGVNSFLEALDAEIATTALGIDGANINFDVLAQRLPTVLSTPDGAAIAAGILNARSLARLDTPQLQSPGLIASSAPLSSIGTDSLAFGLFENQSLVALSQNAPDVFSAVMREGGLTDQRALNAWSDARTMTAQRMAAGFETSLINPCLAVFMSSMASGDPSPNHSMAASRQGCGSCAVAGSYMGDFQKRLMSQGAQRLIIEDTGELTDYAWYRAGPTAHNDVIALNPEFADELADEIPIGSPRRGDASTRADCTDSLSGTANFLSDNLGGILDRLG